MVRTPARGGVAKTCPVCDQGFLAHPYRARTAKYCSKGCWSRRAPSVTCKECGASFRRKYKGQVCCSAGCREAVRKKQVGPNTNAWKTGASLDRERSRVGAELNAWREEVYKRDDYTCQDCGVRGWRLHAHHRKAFADFPELRLDVDNGTALCEFCHGQRHGKDFSRRHRPTECVQCGAPTKGRSETGLCMSCAVTAAHVRRRYAQFVGDDSLLPENAGGE